MTDYPVPNNEVRRVTTLTNSGVLDSTKNECLDRITRIACAVFEVPVAMINFITSNEDVNISCFGMKPGSRSDRRISFCSYTILSDEPFIIENTLDHDHFKDNPQVKAGMNIRAYAGMPLKGVDKTNLGALCIVDTKPRHFTKDEISLLKDLAHWAEIEVNSPRVCSAVA